jgi:hypothetical protein
MLAQYSSSDSATGAVLFVYLLVLLGLAFIPAVIASNKGHSGVGYYLFGLFFFLPALIVALLIKPATRQRSHDPIPSHPPSVPSSPQASMPAAVVPASQSPPGSMDSAAAPSGQQAPIAMRECPSCKESMRRDASVCPHCRRESPAWVYRNGHWWATNDHGDEMWLDGGGKWRAGSEPIPKLSGPTRLVLMSLGSLTPDDVAEIVTTHVIVSRGDVRRLAAGPLPVSLFRSATPTQVLEVKDRLASAGANAEARPVEPSV